MRTAGSKARQPQPAAIRVVHWANCIWLAIMAGSGLQILVAYPYLGPQGQLSTWYPLQGAVPPEWLRLGAWLAGARHWHFAWAWLLLLTAVVYIGYLLSTGEWRRRWFLPRRDFRSAVETARGYLRLRNTDTGGELYNGLQRLAYTGVLVIAAAEVVTGLVLYKPVQLGWLAAALGGYDAARALHLLGLVALALFTLGHVVMVALHPRAFVEMITGGRRGEQGSPEP